MRIYIKKQVGRWVKICNVLERRLQYYATKTIANWRREFQRYVQAIQKKDTKIIEEELNKCLMDIISFHDSAENFYHGFLLGILSNIKGYQIKSNRESVSGRLDIYMKRRGSDYGSAIFKIKAVKKKRRIEDEV